MRTRAQPKSIKKEAHGRMEGAPAAPAPASPPPKQRPVGSFPQDHYSPGKLYTQFRIADGKSPLAWRKTNVFQADASPGSGAGADASSPSPLREAAARRLDAAGGALGPDGERTPIRLPQPSYDKLFRANVPASRLLQRLQANRSLPPLMRRRERAFVQRRLLELVQPREPPSEEELAALEAAASTSRELPNDDQLLVLEKRFAKAVAARAAAYASGKGARPSAKGARAGKGGASAGRDGTPSKRKRAVEDEDEEPTPISGGVSKTSGRTLYIPARLRQPVPDKHAAKRTPVGARAGPPHGENGAGVVSARKALKTSTAYPRIRASGIKGARVRAKRLSVAAPILPAPPLGRPHPPHSRRARLTRAARRLPPARRCRTPPRTTVRSARAARPSRPGPAATCATGTTSGSVHSSRRICPPSWTLWSRARAQRARTTAATSSSGRRSSGARARRQSPARTRAARTSTSSSSGWACAS